MGDDEGRQDVHWHPNKRSEGVQFLTKSMHTCLFSQLLPALPFDSWQKKRERKEKKK
jgi:hypothetical protein